MSVEADPSRCERAARLVEHAGLADTVSFLSGPASQGLQDYARDGGQPLDLIFLDHVKDLYLVMIVGPTDTTLFRFYTPLVLARYWGAHAERLLSINRIVCNIFLSQSHSLQRLYGAVFRL